MNYIDIGGDWEPVYIIAVLVDMNLVRDMSDSIDDMCCSPGTGWQAEHPELKSDIWTAWGSAHGDEELGLYNNGYHGVYYGKPVEDFKVVAYIESKPEGIRELRYYQSAMEKVAAGR